MTGRQAWEKTYIELPVTNWERNDLHDLADFIRECGIIDHSPVALLDAGCGRGVRGLLALLENPSLNLPSVRYTGVDFSRAAINAGTDSASRWCRRVDARGELEEIATATLAPSFLRRRIEANAEFVCENLDTFLGAHASQYDLVIDWMCLHEVPPHLRDGYCHRLGRCSTNGLIINAFSRDLSTVDKLTDAVPGVRKYQLSTDDIRALFPDFVIVSTKDYEEKLLPPTGVTDGIVAAKRAHYLTRC